LVLSALEAKLLFADPARPVKLLDVSCFMPNVARDAKREFAQRRLSTAQFWDLDQIAASHPLGLKHMMPTGDQFRHACGALGIERNHHVLLYDTQGIFSSPRALFTFRAFGHELSSVIDGGMPACEGVDFPVEESDHTSLAASRTSVYPSVEIVPTKIRDYDQMMANSSSPLHVSDSVELVLDARSRGRWAGTDPEPRPNMPSGHIPHSLSLPFNMLLETQSLPKKNLTYTTLLGKDKLEEVFEATLGSFNFAQLKKGTRGVVNTCGSGMTAAILWLAFQITGVDSAIYDESWSGYAARSGSRISREVAQSA